MLFYLISFTQVIFFSLSLYVDWNKENHSVNILSCQTSAFALNFSSSNIFCMIGMIWNQYFLSVKLIFFLQKKFYHFSSLLSLSMHSSFPVTLTTARLNTEYQKAVFFILHCEKSSHVARMITVRLIIAWWPYCSVPEKKNTSVLLQDFPFMTPLRTQLSLMMLC